MLQTDEKKFIELMGILTEIYNEKISPLKTEIYFKLFQKYTIQQLQKAIEELCSTRKTASFPKPAEIIELIDGNIQEKAMIVFAQFEKIKTINSDDNVEFDDPIFMKIIVAMGGWQQFYDKFSTLPDYDYTFFKKDFYKWYEICSKNNIDPPKYLKGKFEIDNENNRVENPNRIIKVLLNEAKVVDNIKYLPFVEPKLVGTQELIEKGEKYLKRLGIKK